MEQVSYQGEQLWIQHLGHFFIIMAFFSAIYVLIAGIQHHLHKDKANSPWPSWIRSVAILHALSILGIILLMLWMMSGHRYEYHYVWEHVSDDLPMKYILSAFWEGQEGSFLLWMFWNLVLAFFLYLKNDDFRWNNITLIAVVQILLMGMILGIHLGGMRLGSNPFLLLRQSMDIPLFQNPNYLSMIKGNGMNPLLQNYWMLIHPPTLFLGFASVIVPICYGISGLLQNQYESWLKPALPWALFSAAILGLGILMGGAWAYEALSFGGYWAWDPVENMSLVPWLILVAGLHSHLIALHTKYSIRAAYILYALAFAAVVYSSYLTRSGVLGDSSVHAFTGLGLGWQLIFFVFVSLMGPAVVYFFNSREIPKLSREEATGSREFWMFIGALILMFSAGLISFTTSIPVYNKLLDFIGQVSGQSMTSLHRSAPVNVVAHHNRFQIWIAVFMGILLGFTLFLQYWGERTRGLNKKFLKEVFFTLVLALILASVSFYFLDHQSIPLYCLMTSAWFAITGTVMYALKYLGRNPASYASIISHTGFGVLIIGIILTGINRKNLVPEKFFQEDIFFQDDPEAAGKHFLLLKNQAKQVGEYLVEYTHDTMIHRFRHYEIKFSPAEHIPSKRQSFSVHPQIQYDNKITKVAASNPSIQRYWNRDIFTLIAQIPAVQMDSESAQKAEDSMKYQQYKVSLNDSIRGEKYTYILRNIKSDFRNSELNHREGDVGLSARFEITGASDSTSEILETGIVIRGKSVFPFAAESQKKGVRIKLHEKTLDQIFQQKSDDQFPFVDLKEGSEVKISEKFQIQLIKLERQPQLPELDLRESDLAVAAHILLKGPGIEKILKPVYLIRDQMVVPLADRSLMPNIAIYFSKIDPEKQIFRFHYKMYPELFPVIAEISEDVPRTDYLVMEAIIFPGINLVWLGALMMIFGLIYGSYFRRIQKRSA